MNQSPVDNRVEISWIRGHLFDSDPLLLFLYGLLVLFSLGNVVGPDSVLFSVLSVLAFHRQFEAALDSRRRHTSQTFYLQSQVVHSVFVMDFGDDGVESGEENPGFLHS